MSTGSIIDPFGSGASFLFAAKPTNDFHANPLTSADTATRNTDSNGVYYTLSPSFSTTAIDTALGVSDNPDSTVSVITNAQFKITYGGNVSATQVFNLVITNDAARVGDVTPVNNPPLSGNLILWLPAITGLTGGGSSKLDGVTTTTTTVGAVVAILIGGTLGFWQLQTGTATGSDVAPADYNSSTNNKKWTSIL